ncbi:MAG: hypothetical protein ABI472_11170 [Ginsengibacter sp.]
MKDCNRNLRCLLLTSIFYFVQFSIYAQRDTLPKKSFDEYIKTRKGFFGKMIKNLSKDTTPVQKANDLTRNDVPYKEFEGYVIRHITIKDLPFGIPLADTSKKIVTKLTQIANTLHHSTRSTTIKNNLFFKENELLLPYLMADNETFLRQLPYIQDAAITVTPVYGSLDSVDVNVVVKDLFSLGGSLASFGIKNTDIQIREDNLSGSGNAIFFQGLYDISRRRNFGGGIGYIQRNIGGSFINGEAGYQSYYHGIDGLKEENMYYARLTKSLVNRYMHWTYELDASYHSTRNMYSPDSIYYSDVRYRYYNVDAWAGYNINSTGYTTETEDKKLRKLVGIRFLNQKFQDLPGKYFSAYNWRFASLTGVLASLSFYRQNFYKSQYIYAFGINEDIPEGLNVTVTAGYIKKQDVSRPFIGFNYQRSAFNSRNNYFSYTFRTEGFLNHNKFEDINLLAGIDYFDHLKSMGIKWEQRTFVNLGIAKQINTVFNEPLYFYSRFGLPEYKNGDVGGSLRATIKAESVFYSPWSVASFRFAPFIFGNTGLFSPYNNSLPQSNIYTSVGAGLRTRSESLIFGTLELRAYYFLKKNIYNENFRFDISTNIVFKSNSRLIRKPDFIQVN